MKHFSLSSALGFAFAALAGVFLLAFASAHAATVPDPVAHWTFDNDNVATVVTDSTGNGNDGVASQELSYFPGVIDKAVAIPNRTVSIAVDSNPQIDDLAAFTYSGWVYTDTTKGVQYVFSKDNVSRGLYIKGSYGELALIGCVKASNRRSYCSESARGEIVPNTWQHIVMTFDDNNAKTVKLYVNGAEVNYRIQKAVPEQFTLREDASTDLYLGSVATYNSKKGFSGFLDDLRLYDSELNASQIASIFYGNEEITYEGFGENTTGGTGQTVYHVGSAAELDTALDAIQATEGNATIKLSGEWTHGGGFTLNHYSNVTIDGLDANVTFENATLEVRCSDNIIVRGLRIRNSHIDYDAFQINSSTNVVIDHNSVSAAGDGNIDITGFSCGASKDITVSWNIFADTWQQGIAEYNNTRNISYHHNLFYNSGATLSLAEAGDFDLRNNVFWQWGSYGIALKNLAKANIIGNYFEIGTGAPDKANDAVWYNTDLELAWIENNVFPAEETDVSRLAAPLYVPFVTTDSPTTAKDLVIQTAGTTIRDAYDQTIIDNINNGIFPPLPTF